MLIRVTQHNVHCNNSLNNFHNLQKVHEVVVFGHLSSSLYDDKITHDIQQKVAKQDILKVADIFIFREEKSKNK